MSFSICTIKKYIENNYRELIALCFFTGLFIRILALIILPDNSFPDSRTYASSGQELFKNGQISSDIVMPLYPIVNFLFGGIHGVKIFDILISSLTTVLLSMVSLKIYNCKTTSFFSALILSFYPHSIFYSISALTETLFVFSFLLSIYFFYSRNYLTGSIFFVLGVLIRPTFDYLALVVIFLFVYIVHKRNLIYFSKVALGYIAIYCVIMSLWWVHNYQKFSTFVRLNLGDGVVLYSGNNPMNNSGGGIAGIDVDLSAYKKIEDPLIRNKKLKEDAIEFILHNPLKTIKLSFEKFLRFWRIWPYAPEYQQFHIKIISLLSYGAMLMLGFFYFYRISSSELRLISPLIFSIIYLTAIHMLTIGSIRYRYPIEPFLIIFASRWMGKYFI